MERYTNFFELHVGFPNDPASATASDTFIKRIAGRSSGWQRSEVRSVHLTRPGCLDPHNVPGVLGVLASKKIFQEDLSWPGTIEATVMPDCSLALSTLSRVGAAGARLEVEFPFACFSTSVDGGSMLKSAWSVDPVTIEDWRLRFAFGERLKETPEWEIHFVIDKARGKFEALTAQMVPDLLAGYGVEIEQTIEYQSQSMRDAGRSDYRLIGTSYYRTAMEAQKEAERLYNDGDLCRQLFDRGYSLKMICEHIVACFQPRAENGGAIASYAKPILEESHAK